MFSLVIGLAWYFSRLDWELESRLARERSAKHSSVASPPRGGETEEAEEVLGLLDGDAGGGSGGKGPAGNGRATLQSYE